jgi:hypothetical protein
VKTFSTNQDENLLLLDDPGRVRSHIATSIVRQPDTAVSMIQRFDFDHERNLLVASDAKSNILK